MKKIKLLLVDEHELLYSLFKMALENDKRYELVGYLKDASLAPLFVEKNHTDLVLMDVLTLNNSNGLIVTKDLKMKHPEIKVLIITGFHELGFLKTAHEANADGFIYKDQSIASFIKAIDLIMAGEKVFPSEEVVQNKNVNFTTRELAILELIVQGYSRKDIASKLFVSEETIKTHISNLFIKTNTNNRTQLAVYAISLGLFQNSSEETNKNK